MKDVLFPKFELKVDKAKLRNAAKTIAESEEGVRLYQFIAKEGNIFKNNTGDQQAMYIAEGKRRLALSLLELLEPVSVIKPIETKEEDD